MPPRKNTSGGKGKGRARPRARGPSPDHDGDSSSEYEPSPEPESGPAAPATPRREPGPPASGSGAASGANSSAPSSNRRRQGGAPAARAWDFTDVPLSQDQRLRNIRATGRMLISWGRPRMAEKLLLNMQYELVQAGVEIPYDRIAHRLRPGSSGSAISQFLGRTRERLVAEGHLVPPVPGSIFRREVRGYVRRDPESDDLHSTRPVTFSEPLEDRLVSLPDAANLYVGRRRRGGRRGARASDEEEEEEEEGEEDEEEESPSRTQAAPRKRQRPSRGSPGSAPRRHRPNDSQYMGIHPESPSGVMEESVEDDRHPDPFLRNDASRFPRVNPRHARRHGETHRPVPRARGPRFETIRDVRGYPPAVEEQDEQDEQEAGFHWRQPPPSRAYPEGDLLPPTPRDAQQMVNRHRFPPGRAAAPPAAPGYDIYGSSEHAGRIPPNPDPFYGPFSEYTRHGGSAYGHGYWPPMPPHPAAASPHGPNFPQHPYPPPPWGDHGYGNPNPDFHHRGHGPPPHNFYEPGPFNEYGHRPPAPPHPAPQGHNNNEGLYRHPGGGPPTAVFNPPAPRRPTARGRNAPSGGGRRQLPPPNPRGSPSPGDESTQVQSPGSDRQEGQGSEEVSDGGESVVVEGEVKYKREESK
ncbi:hypothetical protein F5144DRAFT_623048 [Chaetomium tenue]|uniref:Uncharacterized protein n=1 Tax=Chaetomium tenue TaxID=1854479 RepID=A0ACB7NXZ5_9PEZI|nr:hypothetical protein F5144DRAFT_623048 [Chaetomium globosum]